MSLVPVLFVPVLSPVLVTVSAAEVDDASARALAVATSKVIVDETTMKAMKRDASDRVLDVGCDDALGIVASGFRSLKVVVSTVCPLWL